MAFFRRYYGSEFMKDFNAELQKQQIHHWHTYPKTPKMNAHCERFNRTIQEEFVNFYLDDLFGNLSQFNDKLIDYLLWFNGERPHFALNIHPPQAAAKAAISNTIFNL